MVVVVDQIIKAFRLQAGLLRPISSRGKLDDQICPWSSSRSGKA